MKIEMTRFGRNEIKKPNLKRKTLIVFLTVLIPILVIILSNWFEHIFLQKWYLEGAESIEQTWLSSLASYWGGIIGGLVSGAISLVGIIITINYYRKNDIKNRSLDHQPFLKINIETKDNFSSTRLFDLGEQNKGKVNVNCIIKNIGRGFAQTLTYNYGATIGGCSYNKTICIGDTVKGFSFGIPNEDGEYNFRIAFFDEFMNEYIQEYVITAKANTSSNLPDTELISYYPQVIAYNKK